jgi:SEC-C motif-containing protein
MYTADATGSALKRPDVNEWNRELKGAQPGRNDPCPCGNGKKFKKCCLPRRTTNGVGRSEQDVVSGDD